MLYRIRNWYELPPRQDSNRLHQMPQIAKIDDTFAEAFPMLGTRLIITAIDLELATIAALEFCGNASSVIGCDCEAGIERGLGEIEPRMVVPAFLCWRLPSTKNRLKKQSPAESGKTC